jgi:hypothetical protein
MMRFQLPPRPESLNHIPIPYVNSLSAKLIDGKLRTLRHPLIFYSDILGRCFGKWESREQGIFVHAKLPDSHDCIGEHLRN